MGEGSWPATEWAGWRGLIPVRMLIPTADGGGAGPPAGSGEIPPASWNKAPVGSSIESFVKLDGEFRWKGGN